MNRIKSLVENSGFVLCILMLCHLGPPVITSQALAVTLSFSLSQCLTHLFFFPYELLPLAVNKHLHYVKVIWLSSLELWGVGNCKP